ncbi:alpha/beta hydrolase [Pararhodobacter zhoushanensis]|uniref:alpha/beta hydrolase n=1 Tax=Pararhodobacter zhoushanensis TaxID=2479545 RepID=UPI000F8EFB17|nr:alpha/beta hydrolase [Pararhodobacter zhoushanensis]
MGKLTLLTLFALTRLPEPAAALWLTGRRKTVDGRRIDAKAQVLGELFNSVRVPGVTPTLAESRQSLSILADKFDLPSPPQVAKRDITMPGGDGARPARVYDTQPDATNRPTLLYIHGGGWVQGSIDTHDGLCGQIALEAGIRVISLDYRLAPEHKFPAGPDDVLAAYRALIDDPQTYGVDPARLAVGGDSAGGNLTAALMHDLATAGLPLPKAQVLIYPAVDFRMNSRSMQVLKDAYVLPADRVDWYIEQYLPAGQDRSDPRVAPLTSDRLTGQPQALILHGGHDPLWDDATYYSDALKAVGVPVTLLPFPGQIHAFMSTRRAIPQGVQATTAISDWLRAKL